LGGTIANCILYSRIGFEFHTDFQTIQVNRCN